MLTVSHSFLEDESDEVELVSRAAGSTPFVVLSVEEAHALLDEDVGKEAIFVSGSCGSCGLSDSSVTVCSFVCCEVCNEFSYYQLIELSII